MSRTLRRAGPVALACAALAAWAQAPSPAAPPEANGEVERALPLAEALAPYDDFRRYDFLAWNPQRREMLVRPRQPEAAPVHVVREPGAPPVALTAEAVDGAWFPRGSHEYFLYTSAGDGDNAGRLYRQDTAGAARPLSAAGERVSAVAIAPRGDRIAYASHARGQDAKDVTAVHVMDALRPRTDRVVARLPGHAWSAFRFSADARRLAFVEARARGDARLWVLDAANGHRRRVSPLAKGTAAYGAPAFTRDGRALLATSDRGSDFRRLVLLPLDGKRERVLTPKIAHDVEAFDVSYDANRIAFTTNEDGASVLRFLDAATLRELPRPPLLQGVIGGLRWRPGSDEVAFEVSAAKTALDVFSYAVGANTLTRWTNGNSRRLNMSELPEPRPIEWKGRDGARVTGLLYLPPGRFTGKRPVLVLVHPPGLQARPAFLGRNNYLVNERGLALLYPNPRGSAGFGEAFRARPDEAESDLAALRAWMRTQPALDEARVAVLPATEDVETLAPKLAALLPAGPAGPPAPASP